MLILINNNLCHFLLVNFLANFLLYLLSGLTLFLGVAWCEWSHRQRFCHSEPKTIYNRLRPQIASLRFINTFNYSHTKIWWPETKNLANNWYLNWISGNCMYAWGNPCKKGVSNMELISRNVLSIKFHNRSWAAKGCQIIFRWSFTMDRITQRSFGSLWILRICFGIWYLRKFLQLSPMPLTPLLQAGPQLRYKLINFCCIKIWSS